MGRILGRVAVLLVPFIALIFYLALASHRRVDASNWAPWAIAIYFILATIISALFSRRRPQGEPKKMELISRA
jgi:TRAP-type uncharacterized transport system fused permease subunit